MKHRSDDPVPVTGPVSSRSVLTASSWASRTPPPRRWVWPDWIPRGVTTVFYGDGGTGKSLLAQQLATACASGTAFLGRPVEPCAAFCLFCEDDEDELLRRQIALNAALGVRMGALDRLHILPSAGEDNLLVTYDRRGVVRATPFGETFQALVTAAKPGLIVVDTVADTFGGNEVSRSEVRQFISWLNALARRTGAAVLMLAHPSLLGMASGRGNSGSTAWTNGARSHLYLSRPQDDDGRGASVAPDHAERILARKKANYACRGEEIGVAWRAGAFSPSADASQRRWRLSPAQEIGLRALHMALDIESLPSPGFPTPPDTAVTPVTLWRRCFTQHFDPNGGARGSGPRMAWLRCHQALIAKGLVEVWGEVAWPVPGAGRAP